MVRVSVTEAKNRLSALLDRVREGETVLITDRGIPVAQLAPPVAESDDDRLARLERKGIIRRGRGGKLPSLDILAQPLRPGEKPAGALDALIEERRTGR